MRTIDIDDERIERLMIMLDENKELDIAKPGFKERKHMRHNMYREYQGLFTAIRYAVKEILHDNDELREALRITTSPDRIEIGSYKFMHLIINKINNKDDLDVEAVRQEVRLYNPKVNFNRFKNYTLEYFPDRDFYSFSTVCIDEEGWEEIYIWRKAIAEINKARADARLEARGGHDVI